MRKKGMINKTFSFILMLITVLVSAGSQANTLKLVGNKVVTYIDEHELPARQMDLVSAALASRQVNITATTQAWSGSGLRSGKFSGYIDHYSLNNEGDRYIYSKPYMQMNLHLVSRSRKAESITRLEQLYRERVGIENRYANTDQLRGEREVRWARSPTFFDNLKQLAERRVDYLLVDKAIAEEANLLLVNAGLKPLYMSKTALIKVDISLAMNREYQDAQAVIKDFESGIDSLQISGRYSELLKLDLNRESLLDEEVYSDMVRKW